MRMRSISAVPTGNVSRSLMAGALVLAALLAPARAHAETVFQYEGSTTGVSGRTLIPCVKVALESLRGGVTTSTPGQFGPTLTNRGGQGRSFTLKVTAEDENGQHIRLLPPGPCKDGKCQNINVQGVADDGTFLLFHFMMSSPDGRLDPGSVVGFNPQPEPPGDIAGDNAMIVTFDIASVGDASVTADLVVLNQSTGRVVTVR